MRWGGGADNAVNQRTKLIYLLIAHVDLSPQGLGISSSPVVSEFSVLFKEQYGKIRTVCGGFFKLLFISLFSIMYSVVIV